MVFRKTVLYENIRLRITKKKERGRNTYRATERRPTVRTITNDAQRSRVALCGSADLELASLLGGHGSQVYRRGGLSC